MNSLPLSEWKPRITNGNCWSMASRTGSSPQFGDLRCGRYDLPLRDFVHGIDVIQPFAAILVALMHGVDVQVSGQALRPRLAPLADGDGCRPRRLVAGVALAVCLRVAQSVQVRYRDPRQTLVGGLPVFAVLPLQD